MEGKYRGRVVNRWDYLWMGVTIVKMIGATIAEYFMYQGKRLPTCIVQDDLAGSIGVLSGIFHLTYRPSYALYTTV